MTESKSRPAAKAAPASDDKERVAKVMARAGLCSRRDAEAWILEGRVSVNGKTITSPALNVGPDETIAVDGREIVARQRTRLFLYHKPRGLVTTAKDPEGRATVFDNVPEDLPRVVSVGRLDINTEGLLLLTNDGGLARVLELPSTGWLRRYRVRANGFVTQEKLDELKGGITIDGIDYAGIEAELDRKQGANIWLTMGLREGKNREIKRVLEHLGLAVNRLIRLSFGPFQLGELAEGEVEEIRTRVLQEQLGPSLAEAAGVEWEDAISAEVVTRQRAADTRDKGAPQGERPRGRRQAAPVEAERPRQDRPAPRARPHVSALRGEKQPGDEGPRRRISRATTEDRRGRTVAVERVTTVDKTRHSGEGGTSRNARNFARERRPAEAEGEARPARRPAQARNGFGSDRPQTGRALKEGKRQGARRPTAAGTEESRPARRFSNRSEGGETRSDAARSRPPRSHDAEGSRRTEAREPSRAEGRGAFPSDGRPPRVRTLRTPRQPERGFRDGDGAPKRGTDGPSRRPDRPTGGGGFKSDSFKGAGAKGGGSRDGGSRGAGFKGASSKGDGFKSGGFKSGGPKTSGPRSSGPKGGGSRGPRTRG